MSYPVFKEIDGKHPLIFDRFFFENSLSIKKNVANVEQILAYLLNHISDGVCLLDENLNFVAFNQRFAQIIHLEPSEILGKYFSINPIESFEPSRQQVFLNIEEQLKNHTQLDELMIILPQNSQQIFARVQAIPLQLHPDANIYLGVLSDISHQTHMEQSLKHALRYDALTGLQNRETFFTIMSVVMQNFLNHKVDYLDKNIALVRLNIDKLQILNASIGNWATDMLLKAFVTRIQDFNEKNCQVKGFSRLGGDDFALLLLTNNLENIDSYLANLQQSIQKPFTINDTPIYINVSIGVASYHESNTEAHNNADILISQAEKALRQARGSGGNQLVWFDRLNFSPVFDKIHVQSAFIYALNNSQIVAYFQPKIYFEQPTDDDGQPIYHFEALMRWHHPILGILSPKDFLDEVLDSFSQPLFENMVEHCMTQALAWQQQGFLVKLGINIDVRQLLHDNFLSFMKQSLLKYPNFAKFIEFELTETAPIANNHDTLTILDFLRDNGFCIAIDDFGTGHASLGYLIHFPINLLKFDKLFIQNINTKPQKIQIVKAIIQMAHNMNIKVIAEGVENQAEYQCLKQLGCDATQGFFHGKPMSADEATTWLQQQSSVVYD
ncbi:sensor domain-containing protein [Faucicola boevrei]|uniref:sensor domain-containing protein n=1 Tax=Faucicola boevrei TaxID=346665 RepID=UPI0003810870|nr:GGDEF and EAL domain-containing protein [Moraxella boevrei]